MKSLYREYSNPFLSVGVLCPELKYVIFSLSPYESDIAERWMSSHFPCGYGGLGKTLLAQNLFKIERVQHGFDYLVWLALSHSFVVEQVLLEMCIQIKLRVNETQDQTEDVIKKIHQHLKDRHCLIVLDDVWHRPCFGQNWFAIGKGI